MVTIKNIAEKLEVTEATVSRILNGKGQKHSAQTVEKVFKIAREMGYVADDMARTLATGKSRIISYVIREIHPFMLEGLLSCAKEYEYIIEPLLINEREQLNLQQMIDHITKRRIAAVCVCYDDPSTNLFIEELKKLKIPCALSTKLRNCPKGIYYLNADNGQGMELIVDYLNLCGHHKICYVGNLDGINLYRETLLKKLLEGKVVNGSLKSIIGSHDYQKRRIREVMSDQQARPTVICVSGTGSLISTITELYKLGYKIPEDISIISYGDSPHLSLMSPPITAIREDSKEVGKLMCKKLIEMVESSQQAVADKLCEVELMVRDSVAKI